MNPYTYKRRSKAVPLTLHSLAKHVAGRPVHMATVLAFVAFVFTALLVNILLQTDQMDSESGGPVVTHVNTPVPQVLGQTTEER